MLSKLLSSMLILVIVCSHALATSTEQPFIVLQSTTSTQNSGLYDYLLPIYEAHSGVEVRTVAVGTGQALNNARNGDADVLLVHAKSAETQFVAEGYGVERFDLMYNDFVIIGPSADPVRVLGDDDVSYAFTKIAQSGAMFVSRGDDSGTHKKELAIWRETDIDVVAASGGWYRETGNGMGATLNIATETGAYVLSDRATWTSFKNKGASTILVEGDARLLNQYGVILVDPKRHPHVKAKQGQAFIDWLLGAIGQQAIAEFTVDGKQLFFPNASR